MIKYWVLVIFIVIGAQAWGAAPAIFFMDITSGPNSGGENNGGFAGSFVTVYGANFGASQGTSDIAIGGSCSANVGTLRVVTWGAPYLWYQKTIVQLGTSCATGNFSVTTSEGSATTDTLGRAVTFTIRAGTIRFVPDSPGCTTIRNCFNSMSNGDITYVRNGQSQTDDSGFGNAVLVYGANATAANPFALLTYPNATATIGSTARQRAIYACAQQSACTSGNGLVIGGFNLVSGVNAIQVVGSGPTFFVQDIRMVGNNMTCPVANSPDGCFESTGFLNGQFFGNEVHDCGSTAPQADKQYHFVYYSSDSSHQEVGWNYIHDGGANRGIQFNSTPSGGFPGNDQFDLHVHDNMVFATHGEGINFASVNPTNGVVEAFNNVLWNEGIGGGNDSSFNCIQVDTFDGSTGTVQLYNNSLYGCSTVGVSIESGTIALPTSSGPILVNLVNNIIYQLGAGVDYMSTTTQQHNGTTRLGGNHNIWFGEPIAGIPSAQVSPITTDPAYVAPSLTSVGNFHIQNASPAKGTGTASKTSLYDIAGLLRPNPPSIGAYEFAASSNVIPVQLFGGLLLKGSVVQH